MTDQHDELASAYLDGELTPDELAMVEASDEIRATAAALGNVTNRLATDLPTPDPALRRHHLATALDAFDSLAGDALDSTTDDAPGGVDLGDTVDPDDTSESGQVIDFGRRRWWQSAPPAWLGAAAALVLIVGGLGWWASQGSQPDDDDAAAPVSEAFEDEAADGEATAAEAASESDSDSDTALDSAARGEAATEEASEPEAEAAEEAADAEAATADESAGATSTLADGEAAAEQAEATRDASAEGDAASGDDAAVTGGGLAPGERIEAARVSVGTVPAGADAIALLTEAEVFDAELSSCALAVEPPSGAAGLVGFVPLDIGGRDVEMLVYEPASGSEPVTVVVDDACTEL